MSHVCMAGDGIAAESLSLLIDPDESLLAMFDDDDVVDVLVIIELVDDVGL